MGMKVVIIGAVAAGPKTACRLKRLMPDAQITMIDQDDIISYGGCGIPYYVSGDVPDDSELYSTNFHMIRDVNFFKNAKGVELKTKRKAIGIDRKKKVVIAKNLETGKEEEFPYDKLVLATGSRPNVIPVKGVDLDGVFTISNLHKAIEIRKRLTQGKVEKAVVIGGGAIGIEMADAIGDLWGVETKIVEFMPQLLPKVVNNTISLMIQKKLEDHNIKVYTSETVKSIEGDENGHVKKVITDKHEFDADLVLLATGVRPRGELAKDAGLAVSSYGAIVVNQRMQTSDPDIYAAGDCVEVINLITGKKAYAPMGSLANRQGRVVANNIAGIPSVFDGVVGTFITQVFDISVGATGLSVELAQQEGFDAESVMIVTLNKVHFMPEHAPLYVNIIVDKRTRRFLGFQGVGPMGDSLLARLNAAATALKFKVTIDELSTVELAYAPPFATPVDCLNVAANVAENLLNGMLKLITPQEFSEWIENPSLHEDWIALDVREEQSAKPFMEAFGPRWICLRYDKIRSEYHKLPKDKTLILVCSSGTRSYEVQLFLDTLGYKSLVLDGGMAVFNMIPCPWYPKKS